ncbi:MAG: response regulator transcription factor [Oscillospiraceae bacterium]
MKKILVVEDEDVIRDFVVLNLKRNGYEVVDVNCGEKALEVFDSSGGDFDVALLDIMMPGIDGFTVCKEIRKRSSAIGIIMLSAKSQEMDKVGALMYGADDYITKPFGPAELVARVDAIHRRVTLMSQGKEEPAEITSGPFTLNERSRTLKKDDVAIDLTQVEFQLMEFFMKNINVALERNDILSKVWGENYFGDVKIVDVNIRRLRMKIEDEPSNPRYLTTVWGYGYKWSS